MRKLNFRAWNKYQSKMEFFENYLPDLNDGNAEGNWEIMQSTSLTDKNGKEIYEGDVLSFNSRPPAGSVTFKDGAYWVGEAVLGRASIQGEVIGNIYENPELLTK